MKQFLPVVLFSLLLWPILATGQNIRKPAKTVDPDREPIIQAAIIAGLNTTQIDGDNLSGFRKFGANVGGGAFIRLPKGIMPSFEILYSQKGSKSSKTEAANKVPGDYKLILDYLDVPVLINYNDKDRAIFGLGIVVNNLVRYKESLAGTAIDRNYKRRGVEFVANVTFLIKRVVGINFRYTYSITKINNDDSTATFAAGNQRSNVLTLRVMYIFR